MAGITQAAQLTMGAVQFFKSMSPPPREKPLDPMDGMANAAELQVFKHDPNGFYLGKIHNDHGVNFEASLPADDDRHVLIVAGSASGKGVTYGIQNAIRWKGAFFGIDPKAEIAELVGMRRGTRDAAKDSGTSVRRFIGQKVALLDPMNQTRGAAKKFRVNYDPMVDINISDMRTARKRIAKLAAGMIIPEEGKNAFFSDTAETIAAGAIEAVKILETPKNHRLPFVRQKILGNVKLKNDDDEKAAKAGFEALYDYLTHDKIPDDGHAAEAASLIGELLATDEAGTHRSTLSRNLKWMIDLDMQDHLKPSGFSLWKAMQEGWTVLLILNPDDVGEFRNWLRINVQMALSAKMAQGTNQTGQQTLFFLDEFPVLGRFKEIEEKAAYIRGYGVKLVPVIQSVTQLQEIYKKSWEAFISNTAALIGWGFNDLETEEYFSKRLGKIIIEETAHGTSTSMSMSGASSGSSNTTSRRERMIRFSNELRELGARETMRAFVIPARGKGFTVERVPYMELAKERVFDSIQHIRRWEKNHG